MRVNVPADRCNSPNDASWAGSNLCGQGALYGSACRDLPITSYAGQIASTTGGPNAWEASGSAVQVLAT